MVRRLSRGCLVLAATLEAAWVQAVPLNDRVAAIDQAQKHLSFMKFRIQLLHHEARSSIRDSLDLPLFEDYFRLPESSQNAYDNLGQIQLSEQQNLVRQRMEEWVLALNRRFPIGETCLIDKSGQKHFRVVEGLIEQPHHFSSEEHGSPFFAPTFKIGKGDVHLSEPYMSADIFSWVRSFASPIVLASGDKPGIYHIEIPLSSYQEILASKDFSFQDRSKSTPDQLEEGRFFIFDRSGWLIGDSRDLIDFELKAERHPHKVDELTDYLPLERFPDYSRHAATIFPGADGKVQVERMWREEVGTFTLQLQGREYVVAFDRVPDQEWILVHLDPIGGLGYWEK